VSTAYDGEPTATVRLSREAFACLLRGEAVPAGSRPAVRGDRDAVAVLRAWLDRCIGA
jgi:hypothetical protein